MYTKTSSLTLRWASLIAVLLNILINYLNNARPFSGKTNGDVSAAYPTLFTPASYTFSIWGPVFIGLVAYSIYQILPMQLRDRRLDRISGVLLISSILSIIWVLLFSFEFITLSTIVIVAMLITSQIMLFRIHREFQNPGDKWILRLPFSLYAGWLTVATVTAVAVWFYSLGWEGDAQSNELWSSLLIVFSASAALYISWAYGDYAYPAVVVWALAGIYNARESDHPAVARVALITSIILAVLVVLAGRYRRRAIRIT